MDEAKKLLELMTKKFPPDKPRRHSLTLDDDGELQLTLAINDLFQPILIKDGKSAEFLAAEITNVLLEAGLVPA